MKTDLKLNPIVRFIHAESTAGVLLLVSALIAIVWSNSPWRDYYHHLWDINLSIQIGNYSIHNTLHHWINDGLMSLFFFVVGLELKREIIGGELSNIKKAMLPLGAALGGMLVPAVIYIFFNYKGYGSNGWGIPMATDIAFALGVMALLGKRVPLSLKIFLTALAITDDLGAVLVIAFFYTSEISLANLGTGVLFMAILGLGNYLGVRKTLFYGIIGVCGVWLAFLMSGVHATIAGVLAAMAIPARAKIDEVKFVKELEHYMHEFRQIPPNDITLLDPAQHKVIYKINQLTEAAATPLQRLEHTLHPWIIFLVMPLFAFANAGIEITSDVFNNLFFQGVSMGILAGLSIGKFIGVLGMSWILNKFGIAELPAGVQWAHICGVALLAGIGFTMSLFITNLAFTDAAIINEAKIGIFCASILSGVLGYFVLRRTAK